ncbi:MAG: LysR substrate-binding domain-containing protein [Sneathiella sp.]
MKRHLPPLNQIRSFEAAARHQSFAAAGAELGVTAAAISRLVKSLEDILGMPLFTRGPSHIHLTKAGQRYLSRLTPALDDIAVATAELTGEWQDSLCIAAFPSVSQRWLIPRWASFKESHPEHDIKIKTVLTAPGADRDDIDAAIRVTPPNDTTLIWDKILEGDLMAVCHPDLNLNGTRSLSEIQSLPRLCVRTRASDWQHFLQAANIHIDPRILQNDPEFDNLPMATEAAAQGMGIVIAIRQLIEPELTSGALTPAFSAPPSLTCPFYFTYPPDKARHPTLQAFHNWLMKN